METMNGIEYLSYEKKLRGLELLTLKKRILRIFLLIYIYRYLMEGDVGWKRQR